MLDVRFRPLTTWPRRKTGKQVAAPFRVRNSKYSKTLDFLEKELRHLNARDIVIEIDLQSNQIRNDGWPYSSARPRSSGIIVSFTSKHGPLSLPCDHFTDWVDNLRAIAYHLEHLRKADLYGVSRSGEQYKGWSQLPQGSHDGEVHTIDDAIQLFVALAGIHPADCRHNEDVQEATYRQLVRKYHSDNSTTGDEQLIRKLNTAIGILRRSR